MEIENIKIITRETRWKVEADEAYYDAVQVSEVTDVEDGVIELKVNDTLYVSFRKDDFLKALASYEPEEEG